MRKRKIESHPDQQRMLSANALVELDDDGDAPEHLEIGAREEEGREEDRGGIQQEQGKARF